jgi:hypothetical protein
MFRDFMIEMQARASPPARRQLEFSSGNCDLGGAKET